MGGERRLRITELATGGAPGLETTRLCQVCADVTGVTGASAMLMWEDVSRGWLCATDSVSERIEQLQFDLGEGPCIDACHLDHPVLEPDLLHPVTPRWLAFTEPAIAAGVRAVFGFPLRIGAVRLGALNLYRDKAGPLDNEQYADALVTADVVAHVVLLLQADAPPGEIAAELETGADFQYVVHQAAGMVAAQLRVPVAQALIRLRAHAFGNNRLLTQVAEDVVARTLEFDAPAPGDGRPLER